jgi:hypothetical protein
MTWGDQMERSHGVVRWYVNMVKKGDVKIRLSHGMITWTDIMGWYQREGILRRVAISEISSSLL